MTKKKSLEDLPEIQNLEVDGMPIDREAVKNIQIKRDRKGNIKEYSFTIEHSFRDALRWELFGLSTDPSITPEQRQEAKETYDFFTENLKEFIPTVLEGKTNVAWITKDEEFDKKVNEYLQRDSTRWIIRKLTEGGWNPLEYVWEGVATVTKDKRWSIPPSKINQGDPARIEIKTGGGDLLAGNISLHRQPRNYLQNAARLVGKTMDNPTLFSIPDVNQQEGGTLIKEVISRNTAILGNYLFKLWQQGGGKELVINNLSTLAQEMNNTNFEIKIYLLYLGGYTYPIIDKDPNGGLTLSTEQLFKIQFKYSKKVADKYTTGSHLIIGNQLTRFIKDEPVDYVIVQPNVKFIQALEGKGLGNVLVNDKFIKLALDLSTDIAYKILSFSAGNKPKKKISEDNLIKHLGLDKQLKSQGRPRIRQTIIKGLQELKEKGHIKDFTSPGSDEKEGGMYEYTYSSKYIKHSELK